MRDLRDKSAGLFGDKKFYVHLQVHVRLLPAALEESAMSRLDAELRRRRLQHDSVLVNDVEVNSAVEGLNREARQRKELYAPTFTRADKGRLRRVGNLLKEQSTALLKRKLNEAAA